MPKNKIRYFRLNAYSHIHSIYAALFPSRNQTYPEKSIGDIPPKAKLIYSGNLHKDRTHLNLIQYALVNFLRTEGIQEYPQLY